MMQFRKQAGPATLIVIFVLLCGLIGPKFFSSSSSLQVDAAELTLHDYPIDQKSNLTFGIQNTSFIRSIRVVGLYGSCGRGCVGDAGFEPFELEPRETKKLTVSFKSPSQPGPIEAMFTLYFSSQNSVHPKEFYVRGNAVGQPEPK